MRLYIDPRAGSDKLLEKFPGECEEMRLDCGDIAFFGNGPTGDWWVGIEYKSINDIVGCIKSGRFTGTQLPAMLKTYDVSFLLIEGIARPDPHTGALVRYAGKQNSYPLGLPYQAYDNFLTSLTMFSMHQSSGMPLIVKMSGQVAETVTIIRDLYSYFAKEWDDHDAVKKPDLTKIRSVTYDYNLVQEPQPGSVEYPKHVLRKAVFQVDGLGWEIAGSVAGKYGSVETLMLAGQRELESIDRIGKIMAERIYKAFHGYVDPNYKQPSNKQPRKRKSKDEVII